MSAPGSPPRIRLAETPVLTAAGHAWIDTTAAYAVGFLGRGGTPRAPIEEVVPPFVSAGHRASWLKQVHGSTVLEACEGPGGAGDALVSARGDLALVVVTADCVPVLLARGDQIAAVHAGWRGIVAGIVPAAVARVEGGDEPVAAWVGPAIGACCYEVGEDVAEQVALAAKAPAVIRPGSPRPHLDLRLAVEAQLAAAGVTAVRHLDLCTLCHPELLWSYRREGPGSGRNLSWIARRATGTDSRASGATIRD